MKLVLRDGAAEDLKALSHDELVRLFSFPSHRLDGQALALKGRILGAIDYNRSELFEEGEIRFVTGRVDDGKLTFAHSDFKGLVLPLPQHPPSATGRWLVFKFEVSAHGDVQWERGPVGWEELDPITATLMDLTSRPA